MPGEHLSCPFTGQHWGIMLDMLDCNEHRAFGSELSALSEKYYGSDANRKDAIYLAEYERFLGPLRDQPIRLLELGVCFGASMQMWRDYLPAATIVGLDINEKPPSFPNDRRVHFVRGRQDDPAVLDEVMRAGGGQFDIIIDDCSHVGHLTAGSFAYLFPNALRTGGLYVFEDICTSFMTSHFSEAEPYRQPVIGLDGEPKHFPSHQNGMVGVVKQIFDHVMAPKAAGGITPYPIERMTVLSNIALLQKA
jgi:hypothetical protein